MVEDIVGCKWSLAVIDLVRRGICRPGAMEHAIDGLSAKVLNERLRKLAELIAAAGLEHPSQLGPEHIIRRVTADEVRSLASLYAFLQPGELLEQIPQHAVFQRFWAQARGDSFAPPPDVAALRASKLR